MRKSARIPAATYRLQLSARFRFADARSVVPYLDALGITDLYASPFMAARRGSTHGYDVTDPARLNPEIGTEAGLASLARSLGRRSMGLVADVVPNHMAASTENPWWRDVLEHGVASPFAGYFDIDWRPRRWELQNRVLLPILEDAYETVLRGGGIRLTVDKDGLHAVHHDARLPIAASTWTPLLEAAATLPGGRGPGAGGRVQYSAIRRIRALACRVEDFRRRLSLQPSTSRGVPAEARRLKATLWRLCARGAGAPERGERAGEPLEELMRWQQFTGPIMAKEVEDTALYVYNRLLSVSEVGGSPGRPIVAPAAFHHRLGERLRLWPDAMSATTTHDSKRAEDVRARIAVLSEIPGAWEARLRRWRVWNAGGKTRIHGRPVPEENEEILIYQTLLGTWPRPGRLLRPGEMRLFRDRLAGYLLKTAREAKEHTSWHSPDAEHERAVTRFLDAMLMGSRGDRFLPDFLRFQERIALAGAITGLSQVLIKIAAPGFPDFYQGSELWDLRLVDPDNRGPVDFRLRARLLARIHRAAAGDRAALARSLARDWRDGRIKMFLTWSALSLRKRDPRLFARGDYLPLRVTGRSASQIVAFARRLKGAWAIVIAPIRGAAARLGTGGGTLAVRREGRLLLPRGAPSLLRNVFTGGRITTIPSAAGGRSILRPDILSDFPVALLEK